jgi:hypothetical protein
MKIVVFNFLKSNFYIITSKNNFEVKKKFKIFKFHGSRFTKIHILSLQYNITIDIKARPLINKDD